MCISGAPADGTNFALVFYPDPRLTAHSYKNFLARSPADGSQRVKQDDSPVDQNVPATSLERLDVKLIKNELHDSLNLTIPKLSKTSLDLPISKPSGTSWTSETTCTTSTHAVLLSPPLTISSSVLSVPGLFPAVNE